MLERNAQRQSSSPYETHAQSSGQQYLTVVSKRIDELSQDIRQLEHYRARMEKESHFFGYDQSTELEQLQIKLLDLISMRDECMRSLELKQRYSNPTNPPFDRLSHPLPRKKNSPPPSRSPMYASPPSWPENPWHHHHDHHSEQHKDDQSHHHRHHDVRLPSAVNYECHPQDVARTNVTSMGNRVHRGQWILLEKKQMDTSTASNKKQMSRETWDWQGRQVIVDRILTDDDLLAEHKPKSKKKRRPRKDSPTSRENVPQNPAIPPATSTTPEVHKDESVDSQQVAETTTSTTTHDETEDDRDSLDFEMVEATPGN